MNIHKQSLELEVILSMSARESMKDKATEILFEEQFLACLRQNKYFGTFLVTWALSIGAFGELLTNVSYRQLESDLTETTTQLIATLKRVSPNEWYTAIRNMNDPTRTWHLDNCNAIAVMDKYSRKS